MHAELHPVFRSRHDSNSLQKGVLWKQKHLCRHSLSPCQRNCSCSLLGGLADRFAARPRGPSHTIRPNLSGRRGLMPAPGFTASPSQQSESMTLSWEKMPEARPASACSRARGPGKQSRQAIRPSKRLSAIPGDHLCSSTATCQS